MCSQCYTESINHNASPHRIPLNSRLNSLYVRYVLERWRIGPHVLAVGRRDRPSGMLLKITSIPSATQTEAPVQKRKNCPGSSSESPSIKCFRKLKQAVITFQGLCLYQPRVFFLPAMATAATTAATTSATSPTLALEAALERLKAGIRSAG